MDATILLIEDDPSIREVTAIGLRNAGFVVETANDGREGLDRFEAWTTATCGSGCRGTFDVTLRYDVGTARWGTLRTYYDSAKDGQPQGVRDYPVWLTPVS